MADFETVNEAVETQQEHLENLTEIVDSGFDVKPIAIGVAAGTATIALAKPVSKLAIKGVKWLWSKTGAKLVSKTKDETPAEEPVDQKKPEDEKPAEEKPEEETE